MPQTRSHPISVVWARSARRLFASSRVVGKNRSLSYSPAFEAHVAAGVASRRSSVRREIRQAVDPGSNDWCSDPVGDRQPKLKRSHFDCVRSRPGRHIRGDIFRSHCEFKFTAIGHRSSRFRKYFSAHLAGRVSTNMLRVHVVNHLSARATSENFYSHETNIHRDPRRFIVAASPRAATSLDPIPRIE